MIGSKLKNNVPNAEQQFKFNDKSLYTIASIIFNFIFSLKQNDSL